MLYRYIREESAPSLRAIAGLCRQAGTRLEWLAFGEGPMRPGDQGRSLALPDEHTLVPHLDVEVSAGAGAEVRDERVLDYLPLKTAWIRGELGLQPDKLVLVTARGDSMEPTIRSGDLLLVDTAQNQPTVDAIYVLRVGMDVVSKRLQIGFDRSVTVISDNPAYAPFHVQRDQLLDLVVVGRVVWAARKL